MHKEIVTRKTTPVVVAVLFVIVALLYIYEGGCYLKFTHITFLKITIYFMILALISFEILKSRVYYKYSVIANKLIINKISGNKQKNIESINISDIIYIGTDLSSCKKFSARSNGKYSFLLDGNKRYYCVYENNNEYYSFAFTPSRELLKYIKTDKIEG